MVYGPSSALGSAVAAPCAGAAGCAATVYAPTGQALFYRWQFKLAGVAIAPRTAVRSITVP